MDYRKYVQIGQSELIQGGSTMKNMNRRNVKTFSSISILCFMSAMSGVVSETNGTEISGALYYQTEDAGLPPSSLEHVLVKAYLEDPDNPGACNSTEDDRWYTAYNDSYWCSWCSPERWESSYYLWPLPVGTYYLRTAENWWGGDQDCNSATPITLINEWDYVSDKNFTINQGASISGVIYDEANGGAPHTGVEVVLYKILSNDPCDIEAGWPLLHTVTSPFYSNYDIQSISAGDYVLQTRQSNYYLSEFYTSSGEAIDCSDAEILSVTNSDDFLVEKDFNLHQGGIISGTIYQQGGSSAPVTTTAMLSESLYMTEEDTAPVTTTMFVSVYSTATEEIVENVGPTWAYSFLLDPGEYYVSVAKTAGGTPFAWWATPNTVKNFSAAHKITVTAGQTEYGKDFQLDTLQPVSSLSPIYMLLLDNKPPVTAP